MERMCVCGKKFITYPSRIKKGFGNFCSIKCYAVPVEIRFWKYIRKTDFCWEWIGYKDKNGYGRISKKRRFFSVHRISWELHNGKIPDGLCVLHSCDNPSCVNPDHLFLGSFQNNSNDCALRIREVESRTCHPQKYEGINRVETVFPVRFPSCVIQHPQADMIALGVFVTLQRHPAPHRKAMSCTRCAANDHDPRIVAGKGKSGQPALGSSATGAAAGTALKATTAT